MGFIVGLIPVQYRALAVALAIVVLCVISFVAGWTTNGWRHDAAMKAAQDAVIAQKREDDATIRRLQDAYAQVAGKTTVVYRDIYKEIPNATDGRVCFANADALSLWNRAVAGGVSKDSERVPDTGAVSATDSEVLENAVTNLEICHRNLNKLNAIKLWDREMFE